MKQLAIVAVGVALVLFGYVNENETPLAAIRQALIMTSGLVVICGGVVWGMMQGDE